MQLMPFQKGNKLGKQAVHQRRDATLELIAQLNEVCKTYDGTKRDNLHRLIKNLIAKATTGDDVVTIVVGGGIFPIEKVVVISQWSSDMIAKSVRYFDKAGTSKEVNRDAAHTAGVLMHKLKDGVS